MAWTYNELSIIQPAMQQIARELERNLERAERDSAAQRALWELTRWAKFLDLLESYELLEGDPRSFLPAARQFSDAIFFRVHVKPFNLLYVRDPVQQVVTAVAVFHDKDKARNFDRIYCNLR